MSHLLIKTRSVCVLVARELFQTAQTKLAIAIHFVHSILQIAVWTPYWELPVTCLRIEGLSSSNREGRTDNAVPVVNGCLQKHSNVISKRACGVTNMNDIYSYLPLSYLNNIPFFNLYCALCNMESENYIDEMRGNPTRSNHSTEDDDRTMNYFLSLFEHNFAKYALWDLYIFCTDYIDYSHYLFLLDFMMSTEKLDCIVRFKNKLPTNLMQNCMPHVNRHPNVKNKCSDTQRWRFADSDVEWACNKAVMLPFFNIEDFNYTHDSHLYFEGYNGYRQELSSPANAFCYLCKPSGHRYNNDAIIDQCNDTSQLGLKSVADAQNCKDNPLIYYFSPFKNRACVLCNGIKPILYLSRIIGVSWISTRQITVPTFYPVLRNMFQVFTESEGSVTALLSECSRGQLLDLYTVLV